MLHSSRRLICTDCLINLLIAVLFSLYIISCSTTKVTTPKPVGILDRAYKEMAKGNYSEAERLVNKYLLKDSSQVKAYLLLSDISDELSKPEQQQRALEKVVKLDSVHYPLSYKLLGNFYFKEGDYSKAFNNYRYYKNFKIVKDSSFIANRLLSSEFSMKSIKRNAPILIKPAGTNINSELQEYWPAVSTNDSILYFTRLTIQGNNYPLERIFYSLRGSEGWEPAEQLMISGDENTNIGTMCISADGKLLFYTACGQNDGYGSCDIYYSIRKDGKWLKPRNAGRGLNSAAWEAQPSVSSDSRYLYFASNRSGGFGGMDIWRIDIHILDNGSLEFTNPKNLGKGVNTKENDFSPFIHADGATLYFSSEGRYGLGGSDIFISRFKDSVWGVAENLGYPINSRFNDDGLVISPTSKTAFFSSNRTGAIGGSKDLFQVDLPDEFLPEKVGYLAGNVFDKETGNPIEATIVITDLESNVPKSVKPDLSEGYITTLVYGHLYSMHVEKDGYLFYSRQFNLTKASTIHQAERFDIFLEPVNVGKKFMLSNVFFDFNSAVLKPESSVELQKLITFLKANPRLRIEISGHTDNIGGDSYNMDLSTKRAKAIFDYLTTSIEATRLTYKGYGSTIPVTSNDAEEGRAKNRRCEVKIIGN